MFVYTEPEEAKSSESEVEENNTTAAMVSNGSAAGLLKHFSQNLELLSSMPSVLELLSQAAQSSLEEQEREVGQVTPVLNTPFIPTVKGGVVVLKSKSNVCVQCYSPKHTEPHLKV